MQPGSELCDALCQKYVLSDKQLIWLFVTWAAVAVICSLAFFVAEVDVNPDINDPSDALWWGIVTLTTVGYGDILAVTNEGRLASSVLMVLGITLFAAITATITSRFVHMASRLGATPCAVERTRQWRRENRDAINANSLELAAGTRLPRRGACAHRRLPRRL